VNHRHQVVDVICAAKGPALLRVKTPPMGTALPSPLADFGVSALDSYQLVCAIVSEDECDLPHID
jgi:hypothetical protein